MQYEMGFDKPSPVGIFTGRMWQAQSESATDLIARIRRGLPLDVQVSDQLLAILAGRGVIEEGQLDRFFYPSLDQLLDPFTLLEMDRAVTRICRAAERAEQVAIHGDFDVDGITGCAVLAELFGALSVGDNKIRLATPFIPDRATDGYGVATRKVREWASEGVSLLVTVDTGAAAGEEIDLARNLGIDVIVLDHHIFDERPAAQALVNPCRSGATYGNPELCGVAVAFKLAQALKQGHPESLPDDFLGSILDLVALGLVADQMSLTGENRILVKKGLERLNDRNRVRPGLAALLDVSGLDRDFPVNTGDFAYQIAPRLNACGRIGRVMSALELLLTKDLQDARRLAEEADRTNKRRKEQDLLLKQEAISMADPYVRRGDPGLVLSSTGWHKGIIGIGAARLVEQFQLPVILISVEGDEARGSARSVPDVDVKVVLDGCSDLLVRYGGHSQAAGLTLRASDIPEFRLSFLEALRLRPTSGPVTQGYDLALDLGRMTTLDVVQLVQQLEFLEPFGAGNRKPVFHCCGLFLQRPPTPLSGGAHLRFAFRGPEQPPAGGVPALGREFVSFGSGEAWRRMLNQEGLSGRDLLARSWDILFQIGRNTYRPRNGAYDPVQQLLVDIRPAVEA